MINIRENLTLKACRYIADIKAAEIASDVGVSVNTLYKWESGELHPNGEQMARIVHCFANRGYAIDVNDINFF